MKQIFRKNQVVLTLLAVMIAVAGYLNYTADRQMDQVRMASGEGGEAGAWMDISDEDILAENSVLQGADSQLLKDGQPLEDSQSLTDGQSPEDGQLLVEEQGEGIGKGESEETGAAQEKTDADGEAEVGRDTPGTAVLTGAEVLDYVAGVQLSREQTRARNKEMLMEIIGSTVLEEEQKQEAIDAMLKLTATAERETAAESLLAAKGFENSIVYINEDSVDVVIPFTALTDAQRAQIEDIVKRKAEVTADKIVITLLELEK